jgi:2,3-bisphosphoglycerate-independent phosphoglycerate mutase
MILDGYGINPNPLGNAIYEAKKPVMDGLMAKYPHVQGAASGLAVGLPEGQMGNSEVGHLNMGAGRIVYQELTRITKSIQDGDFFSVPAFLEAADNCKKHGSALHLFGLVSDGGVHSHNTHIYGLLELAKRQGLTKVYVHCFLDGRDTPPTSGKEYVSQLEEKMKEIGVGKVASVAGRYYAMDRDNRWDRVEKAYRCMVFGEGEKAKSATAGIQASYDKDVTDEFVLPFNVVETSGGPAGDGPENAAGNDAGDGGAQSGGCAGKSVALIGDGDSVIFFNFRPDRAREITRAFCDDDFKGFDRGKRLKLTYVCFVDYDDTIQNKSVAFQKESITNTFGEFLAAHGMTQARIAETEKYAHVTFFFNGGVEEPNPGEDRILVNSPKVATYDLQPEMSAPGVCEKLCEAIRSGKYDVIIINFANPDMVGHTGVEAAAVKAIEAVDACVGKAVDAVLEVDGILFVCADHGNAEMMIDYETGEPFTAHTTNPVPFVLVNADPSYRLRDGGKLADIVPTLIELMGMEQPKEMTGQSLLVR